MEGARAAARGIVPYLARAGSHASKMVDRIATSANVERVIKPPTFISPKPGVRRRVAPPDRAYGCRERLSNGRASHAVIRLAGSTHVSSVREWRLVEIG